MFGNTYRYILNNSLTFIYDKPTSNIWGILESGPIVEQILIAFPLEIMKYELFKTLKINLSLLPPSLSISLSLSHTSLNGRQHEIMKFLQFLLR